MRWVWVMLIPASQLLVSTLHALNRFAGGLPLEGRPGRPCLSFAQRSIGTCEIAYTEKKFTALGERFPRGDRAAALSNPRTPRTFSLIPQVRRGERWS